MGVEGLRSFEVVSFFRFVSLVLSLTSVTGSGHHVSIITPNQTLFTDPGFKVTLDCKFQADHYDLFEFPILWRKRQIPEEDGGEAEVDGSSEGGSAEGGLQINVMASINEPFLGTNKYHVGFLNHPPNHNLQLTITNATVEDSGNYSCEFRGPQSNVLHSIRHVLFVRAPISTLLVSEARSNFNQGNPNKDPQTRRNQQQQHQQQQRQQHTNGDTNGRKATQHHHVFGDGMKVLYLEENRFAHVRCDALGGYPPPWLEIFIGRRNVTHLFNYKATLAKVIGQRGFKRLIFAVERTLHNFLPSGSDDQLTLSCVATVQGLKPVIDGALLDIDYSPRIRCSTWENSPNNNNNNNLGAYYYYQSSYEVSIIQCQIEAKPQLTAAFWVLDRNGTTLREGEMHPDYWTVRTEQSPVIWRMELFARRVKASMFGTYALVAENRVAIERYEIKVSQARKIKTTDQTVTTSTTSTTKILHRPIMSGNRELQRDLGRRRYVHLRSSGISSCASPVSRTIQAWLRILSCLVLFLSTTTNSRTIVVVVVVVVAACPPLVSLNFLLLFHPFST